MKDALNLIAVLWFLLFIGLYYDPDNILSWVFQPDFWAFTFPSWVLWLSRLIAGRDIYHGDRTV